MPIHDGYMNPAAIAASWGLDNPDVAARFIGTALRLAGYRDGKIPTSLALNSGLAVHYGGRTLYDADKLGDILPLFSQRTPTPDYALAAFVANALIDIDQSWADRGGDFNADLGDEWDDVIEYAAHRNVSWRLVTLHLYQRDAGFYIVDESWNCELMWDEEDD